MNQINDLSSQVKSSREPKKDKKGKKGKNSKVHTLEIVSSDNADSQFEGHSNLRPNGEILETEIEQFQGQSKFDKLMNIETNN